MRSLFSIAAFMTLLWCGSSLRAQTAPVNAPVGTLGDSTAAAAAAAPGETQSKSKFRSAEDGWFDCSGFLDQRYGFLPIGSVITEPAVGYGISGALAFIDKPLVGSDAGYGRPNMSAVGGLWTENDTWGAFVGDSRYWFDDKLQTRAGILYASVNLDFYGIGEDAILKDNPLRYNLEPKGGVIQGKYRIGKSRLWAGIGYGFFITKISFDAPENTPRLPDYERDSNVGGLAPTLVFDSRDNIFTPLRGTYVETTAWFCDKALGGDNDFQHIQLVVLQYVPLASKWFLGLRGDGTASFGDEPFYALPYISLRGVAAMRYQGEQVAQLETELRWQFWKRFSLIGFAGYGGAWNDFERLDNSQTVFSGGTGFRYELARDYGIHAGLDVGFSEDEAAIYIQVGSAWMRM